MRLPSSAPFHTALGLLSIRSFFSIIIFSPCEFVEERPNSVALFPPFGTSSVTIAISEGARIVCSEEGARTNTEKKRNKCLRGRDYDG
jgi:hypothetical protein